MKTKSASGFIIFLLLIFSFSVKAQNDIFTGEWTLNKEKTVLADNQLFLSKIKIELKNDSILMTRTYQNGNGDEYPFDENLSLDGKESKIIIYDMPRTSNAKKSSSDGAILIESKTTFTTDNGEENMVAKETWKVDNEGKMLAVEFSNKTSAGEVSGIHYFNKVK
jgi:hypothetical protein